MAKVMRTIVKYGEVFGATRLLPLDGPIHGVTSMGMAGLVAVFDVDNSALWADYKPCMNS
jgi:hypothetical protein